MEVDPPVTAAVTFGVGAGVVAGATMASRTEGARDEVAFEVGEEAGAMVPLVPEVGSEPVVGGEAVALPLLSSSAPVGGGSSNPNPISTSVATLGGRVRAAVGSVADDAGVVVVVARGQQNDSTSVVNPSQSSVPDW